MKIIILMIGGCIAIQPISSQNSMNDLLQEIERNNTVLSAFRQQAEAEKIGNKTGIYLENPEVEFHYLWGNKAEVGNRTDFSASQNFDFPTAYHYKKKVSDGKNQQVDLKYQIERKEVLWEVKQTCIQWTYQNKLLVELEKRVLHARQIADAYEAQYTKGNASILDLNKAKYGLLNAQKEMSVSQTERDRLQAELIRLNGGKELLSSVSEYAPVSLPSDFEQWYHAAKKENSLLQYLWQETALSGESEKLQRSMNLPKFSVGYMSEKVMTEQFQGVMVGISIPLWENKNTVKQIKARTLAHQAVETDAQLRFYNETKALFAKAQRLKKVSSDYNESLAIVNNSDLLKKALDAGKISLIEYMIELSIYYEAAYNILETERDYQLTVAELSRWEL